MPEREMTLIEFIDYLSEQEIVVRDRSTVYMNPNDNGKGAFTHLTTVGRNWNLSKLKDALITLSQYEKILSKKRLTEDFNLDILKDNAAPELYDDMDNLYQVYSRLGELEKIYWKKWENNDD